MSKLDEVLEKRQAIERLAKQFGFMKVRLFFEKIFPAKPLPLSLVVGVDEQNGGEQKKVWGN